MTVSTTSNRISYTGNGSTTVFGFPYKFIATTDIKVYLAGVLQTTGYTVGTPTDSGANITFTTAPANGAAIVFVSDPSRLQSTSLPSTGPFPAKSVETALDKLTLLIQRVYDLTTRSLTLNDADTSSVSTTLPSPIPSQLIGWNAQGTGLTTVDPASVLTIAGSSGFTTNTFSGDGATTVFALSDNPGIIANVDVFIAGLRQRPNTDYTMNGFLLTFAVAPPSGSANILVKWGTTFGIGVPANGSVSTPIIADSAVTTAKIVDGAVTSAKISDANVTTPKIADANVTPAKLSAAFGSWVTAASAALARTALGLTSAAITSIGTAAGNLIALDGSGKLPAVDGSQLTGINAGSWTRLGAISISGTGTSLTGSLNNLSGYRFLRITANNASLRDGSEVRLKFSTDNGATWISTGYSTSVVTLTTTPTITNATGTASYIPLTDTVSGGGGGTNLTGAQWLVTDFNQASNPGVVSLGITAIRAIAAFISATLSSTTSRNAIQITVVASTSGAMSGYFVVEGMN